MAVTGLWRDRLRRATTPVRRRRRVGVRTGPWLPGPVLRLAAGAGLVGAAAAGGAPRTMVVLVGLGALALALRPGAALAAVLVGAVAVVTAIGSAGPVTAGAFAALALAPLAVVLAALLEGLSPWVRVELAALRPGLLRWLAVQGVAQPTLLVAALLRGQQVEAGWLGPAAALGLVALAVSWLPALGSPPAPPGEPGPRVELRG